MGREKDNGLVLVSLRLRKEDVAEARRWAKVSCLPYQHVIRGWVSSMATAVSTSAGSR